MYCGLKAKPQSFDERGAEMRQNEIEKLLHEIKKPALIYSLALRKDISPTVNSYMGGKPYMKKGDRYPKCQHCKQKLNFIFQLYIPNKHLKQKELYVFYYCFQCDGKSESNGFAMKKYINPTIEEMKVTKELDYITYAEFILDPAWSLPDWEGLIEFEPVVAEVIEQEFEENPWDVYEEMKANVIGWNDFEYLSFYGGYPKFLKESEIPECTCCNEPMELWMQVDSCDPVGLKWRKNGCLYLFRCFSEKDEFKIRLLTF